MFGQHGGMNPMMGQGQRMRPQMQQRGIGPSRLPQQMQPPMENPLQPPPPQQMMPPQQQMSPMQQGSMGPSNPFMQNRFRPRMDMQGY